MAVLATHGESIGMTRNFNPIRDALGDLNDSSQSVESIVKHLKDCRDRLLQQVLVCKPDAERYRKLKQLGNGWLANARKVSMETDDSPSVDEQLDRYPNWTGVEVELPISGTVYFMPGHPTEHQLLAVCKALREDWQQLGTPERDRIKTKARAAWRAIAQVINEPYV